MNIGTVIKRVRDTAGDTNALQFNNATIVDWVNDAIRLIVVENSLLQTTATTTNSTGLVPLPDGIFKLYSVYVNGDKIVITSREEWEKGQTNETGMPRSAFVWASQLNLKPAPQSQVTVEINYLRTPTELTDPGEGSGLGAELGIPVIYHDRVVMYCLAQVALQDDDVQKYQVFYEMFTSGVINLAHATQQEDDLYPGMSISPRDQGDDGYWARGVF